jgi:hypothetical protein
MPKNINVINTIELTTKSEKRIFQNNFRLL